MKFFWRLGLVISFFGLPSIGFAMWNDESDSGGRGFYIPPRQLQFDAARQLFYVGTNLSDIGGLIIRPLRRNQESVLFTLETIAAADEKQRDFRLAEEEIFDNFPSFADDQRKKVNHPRKYPWCTHGHVVAKFGQGCEYLASGVLFDREHFLTAAHVLYDLDTKREAKSIVFYPGMDGKSVPWRSDGVSFEVPQKYYNYEEKGSRPFDFDIGIVKLASPLGEKVGFLPLSSEDNGSLGKTHVSVTGYPLDRGSRSMYTMDGPLMKSTDPESSTRLFYDVFTYEGQSGSGVCTMKRNGDTAKLVAVHTCQIRDARSGIRFTPEIMKFIESSKEIE